MAAAFPVPPRAQSQVEIIGRLYLTLWKRLDLTDGENKWADIVPPDAAKLDSYIEHLRTQARLQNTSPDLHEEAEARYRQVRAIVQQGAQGFDRLKQVLRDEAFRLLDQARAAR